ncbi:MAG: HD domain-containing protein [Candidatus Taylorbacteria bacterium]
MEQIDWELFKRVVEFRLMKKHSENSQKFVIPPEVSCVTKTLEKAGFKAYLVGGCVRDLLLARRPKDWDVTTNAKPEEIIALFSNTFYENNFGTVGVVNEETKDETLKVVEVTPFRLETTYSDNRRPDAVSWSDNVNDDLKRRDFTINAIALEITEGEGESFMGNIIDPFDGRSDLKRKIVKIAGDAHERLEEDALRLLRGVRIATELDFTIDSAAEKAIIANAELLKNISPERIRDEFVRIIMSDNPSKGIQMAQNMGILKFVVPELLEGIGVEQNKAHAFDVWTHLLETLKHAKKKEWPLEIRLAALFHDISKPETRRRNPKTGEWSFYGHEVVGARVTKNILTRLKFSREIIAKVTKLVRWHMFFSDTEQITLSAVRRMINNVGRENIWDLMNVRICDRIGTGRPKEDPYRLRKYKSMIEEALKDPISVGMLKINGARVMEVTKMPPGPKIGYILHALLEEVLEDPKQNTAQYLEERAQKLALLDEKTLKNMGEKGKEKKEEMQEEDVKEIRKKYWVQ